MRFEFWRATPVPLTLRVLHTIQLVVITPAIPFALLLIVGLFVKANVLLLGPLPWLFSAFATFIILRMERAEARKMKLTQGRYTQLQMLKVVWSVVFFMPLLIAVIASTGMKFMMWGIFHHPDIVLKTFIWCNVAHW
jgi:hypothetical protein